MKTKKALFGIFIASIFALIFGGRSYATAGNTAEISGGKTWNICIEAGAGYDNEKFVVNIEKSGFESQLALGSGDCKTVALAAGTYTARLNNVMGTGVTSYEIADSTLTFNVGDALRKFLNVRGSISYTIEGSGEESPFELLFSMPGECQFNGNANVSGETCKDGDGNPLTNKKYIDTNVALFSEDNAGRDFEIYFTLTDYATTQLQQGTLFNAKYENSSMYYPGFTIRTVGTDGETMEITGRLGKNNTDADKANNSIVTADIEDKVFKIVRVGGMVSYSIDGGELIPFQDYKNFSRYFNQTAVFGASRKTDGTPQRYYNGTIKNIRVYLKKQTTASIVFDANGGTGTMAKIDNIAVGTDVTLPANAFTLQNATFDGWNTKVNGSGTAYADGATVAVDEVGTLKLYAQWTGTDIAVLDDGYYVVGKMKTLANSKSADAFYEDQKIKAVKTADNLPDNFDAANQKNIISDDDSPLPIYAWFENSSGTIYVYSIATEIYGGDDMGYMFAKEESLVDISALSDWNTSNVKEMNNMFYGDALLSDISPIAVWNTSNVTEFYCMFEESGITSIDALETKQHEGKNYVSWDVSKANDMGGLFQDAEQLTDISALASWDTSGVESMGSLFRATKALTDISPISTWNTSNVTDVSMMFCDSGIRSADALETKRHEGKSYVSWDMSHVVDMSGMFWTAFYLNDISALASWDVSNVEDMNGLFIWCSYVSDFSAIKKWNTSKVEDFSEMFGRSGLNSTSYFATKHYDDKDYTSWDVSSAKNMYRMFYATKIRNLNGLDSWDTGNVENMSYMFDYSKSLTDISAIAAWDTSGATDISGMFSFTGIRSAAALETKRHEGKSYVSWDMSRFTTLGGFFADAEYLSDISALASWDMSNMTSMYKLFYNTAIANVDAIADWDVSNVTDMGCLFQDTKQLTDISGISHWNTSKVTSMYQMFFMSAITDTDALETKRHEGDNYVSWDVSHVTNMEWMFNYATSLSDVSALESWDTSSVTSMYGMFNNVPASPLPLWYQE